jgi:hypothetical protein
METVATTTTAAAAAATTTTTIAATTTPTTAVMTTDLRLTPEKEVPTVASVRDQALGDRSVRVGAGAEEKKMHPGVSTPPHAAVDTSP